MSDEIELQQFYRSRKTPQIAVRPTDVDYRGKEEYIHFEIGNLLNPEAGWKAAGALPVAEFSSKYPEGPFPMILGMTNEVSKAAASGEPTWLTEGFPPGVIAKLRWLDYEHLSGLPREISMKSSILACGLVDELMAAMGHDDPVAMDQMIIALQRIIDAKDAAVRVAVAIEQAKAAKGSASKK